MHCEVTFFLSPNQVGGTNVHTRLLSQINLVLHTVENIEVSQLNTCDVFFFNVHRSIIHFDDSCSLIYINSMYKKQTINSSTYMQVRKNVFNTSPRAFIVHVAPLRSTTLHNNSPRSTTPQYITSSPIKFIIKFRINIGH